MILRVIRGIFGLIFAEKVSELILGLLQIFKTANDSSNYGGIFAVMLVGTIIAVIFGYLFFGLRTFINWLHTKNYGVPHPSLVKKWSL
jgi:uncharacterized membrane protein